MTSALSDPLHYPSAKDEGLLASLIIATYNRCDALPATLEALGKQTVAPELYEVIVVDDGSPDATQEVLGGISIPAELRVLRQPQNQGISAGRNLAIRNARGRLLIFISDDLIVPEDFIEGHLRTHEQFPGSWVVGGFEQLPSIRETPFGRYLDNLELGYDESRKSRELAPGIWELGNPTARNLSVPRADLERIGLFDEQLRMSCEDVDLAGRAREAGVRFIYNEAIRSLHNDQVGDLHRYLRAQVPRTRDTVVYYFKHRSYYVTHGDPPIARTNGRVRLSDGPSLIAKKAVKAVLATAPVTRLLEWCARTGEAAKWPDPLLWRLYGLLSGIYIYRGWRHGLEFCKEKGLTGE
jgi:GT2 family glycosyltransferase